MKWFKKISGSQAFAVAQYSAVSTGIAALNGVITARLLLAEGRGYLAVAISAAGLIVLISALGSNVAIRRLLPSRGVSGVKSFVFLSASLSVLSVIVGLATATVLDISVLNE